MTSGEPEASLFTIGEANLERPPGASGPETAEELGADTSTSVVGVHVDGHPVPSRVE